MYKLYPYQLCASERIVHAYNVGEKGFGLFFEMGLGKTITTLDAIAQIKPKTILIVCPLSLIDMWKWEVSKQLREFNYTIYTSLNNPIIKGIVVTNYESLHKVHPINWDMVILDECQKIKNYKTQIWKTVNSLNRKFTLALSGTPVTNTFMDIYSIVRLISDTFDMPASLFERYFIKDGSSSRTEELYADIQPFTAFAKLTSHIEMPSEEDIELPCYLDAVDNTVYERYKLDWNLTALQLITKLVTICGYVGGEKLKICKDLVKTILEKNEKVIIFVTRQIAFEQLCKEFNCQGICGETKNRQEIVNEFNQNGKVLVCNTKAGGLGLNLQSANNVIYWQHDYELGALEQSKGRIFRIGQDKPCKYYHLIYKGTIDEVIYDCLKEKKNVINELLKLYGENRND